MDKEIKVYKLKTYSGKLDLSHGRVIGMAQHAGKLFLNSPVPHFISTFLYFYHVAPKLENPVTVSAWRDSITVHPGQGRLLASYFRKDKTLPALLIPLHQLPVEVELLDSVSRGMKTFNEKVFIYKNENHDGISTAAFRKYFYPTKDRLDYEDEKLSLLSKLVTDVHGTIKWQFTDRDAIKLGDGRPDVNIACDAEGFYQSVVNLAFNHYDKSEKFKIL